MTSVPFSSLNPFATCTADELRDRLTQSIDASSAGDSSSVWHARTVDLVTRLAPVLVWLRDHKTVQLDARRCYAALGLREIATLCDQKVALLHDPETGGVQELHAEDLPADLHLSLCAYLADVPGYDPVLPFAEQQSQHPATIHSYTLLPLYRGLFRSTPASRAA